VATSVNKNLSSSAATDRPILTFLMPRKENKLEKRGCLGQVCTTADAHSNSSINPSGGFYKDKPKWVLHTVSMS